MTTHRGTRPRVPVAVPDLNRGDTIHVSPHPVFRHSDNPYPQRSPDADVLVDSLLDVGAIVLIVWHIPPPAGEGHARPALLGATAYDADDSVLRLEAAAA